MIKKYALITGLMCIAPALYAQEVKDIQVRGVRYIEPATVISYLPFQQGDTITEAQRNEWLKALLKTGRHNKVLSVIIRQNCHLCFHSFPIDNFVNEIFIMDIYSSFLRYDNDIMHDVGQHDIAVAAATEHF